MHSTRPDTTCHQEPCGSLSGAPLSLSTALCCCLAAALAACSWEAQWAFFWPASRMYTSRLAEPVEKAVACAQGIGSATRQHSNLLRERDAEHLPAGKCLGGAKKRVSMLDELAAASAGHLAAGAADCSYRRTTGGAGSGASCSLSWPGASTVRLVADAAETVSALGREQGSKTTPMAFAQLS